jgi:hypothetical protein
MAQGKTDNTVRSNRRGTTANSQVNALDFHFDAQAQQKINTATMVIVGGSSGGGGKETAGTVTATPAVDRKSVV